MTYKDYLPLVDSIHYQRYIQFIDSRASRQLEDALIERHHIVPRAFGRADDFTTEPWNIIALSPREHFIAHMILWKLYAGKMATAFRLISKKGNLTARQYQLLQRDVIDHKKNQKLSEEHKEAISKALKGKPKTAESIAKRLATLEKDPYIATPEIGAKISQELLGRIRVHKGQEERSIKISELQNYIDSGWLRGRKTKPHQIPARSGYIWVKKGSLEKKIDPEELQGYIDLGWEKGRSNDVKSKISNTKRG